MDCSTPGFPVVHHLLELAQTHVHWVMPSNHLVLPLSSPSPPAFNFSQSQSFLMSRLFALDTQSVGASASASVLPMNIQDWFSLGLTGWISLQSKGLWRVFSNTTVQKSINSSALSFLYGPALTSIHDYWKNHSFWQDRFCQQSNVSAF